MASLFPWLSLLYGPVCVHVQVHIALCPFVHICRHLSILPLCVEVPLCSPNLCSPVCLCQVLLMICTCVSPCVYAGVYMCICVYMCVDVCVHVCGCMCTVSPVFLHSSG